MRWGTVVGMLEPNLICENGHKSYSPTPEAWITTKQTLRFCPAEKCQRNEVRIRAIDGAFRYVSPFRITPPQGVEEE